jgi:hypothetical protein
MTEIPPTQKNVTILLELPSDPIEALNNMLEICGKLDRMGLKYDWEATP